LDAAARWKDFHETKDGIVGAWLIPNRGHLGRNLGHNALALWNPEHNARTDICASVHFAKLVFIDTVLRRNDRVVITFPNHVGLITTA
jgi:hypothetical protein